MSANFKNEKPSIDIREFVEKSPAQIQIEVLAGSEQSLRSRRVTSARIQKLGLALAGFSHYIHQGRVQIVGQSEISYLNQLSVEKRIEAIRNLDLNKICCVLLTKNLEPPREFLEIAEEFNLPVLRTPEVSSIAIGIVSDFLQEMLAPQTMLHGVLMGMYGLGVFLQGESGIGKSECALDLIVHGHYLISDDAVMVKRIGDKLEGAAPELTYEHLEIRGLGIINIRDLFGVSAIGKQKKIDLCIELKKWDELDEIERLGLETRETEIFGVRFPKFVLPVSSGRNVSTLVETAVRVHLLRANGYDAARKLVEKHTRILSSAATD
ncbi:MAG TPA: HPr(Ser) kinase/phosphatase [Pyrinomonadaceae bacterium]|nr:HPr(Ser) kinase/phosphatase [Pyrinomonadaceae bacterium]